MSKIGRNDPCPCGSGRKYKKCCLAKDRRAAAATSVSERATERALRWLYSKHEAETFDAVEGYLRTGGNELVDDFEELDEWAREVLTLNAHEWLLADGDLVLDGEEILVRELLMGADGPPFGAEERGWMEAFLSRPLALYEVVEVEPGEGLRLRDLLHPDEPATWVVEHTASRTLVRWDVLGARLVETAGVWRFSGALYPISRDSMDVPALVEDLRQELEREAEGDPEIEREILAFSLPWHWLGAFSASLSQPLPELRDASSGEPLLLVTDTYHVRDWERLEEALAARPDVDGDREMGWNRFEEVGGGVRRSLLALNPGPGDELELFAKTRGLADVGRGWFEAVAGDAVEFRSREMVDPAEALSSDDERFVPAADEGEEMPMDTGLMEQLYRQHYEDWADVEIPALGGRTPRKAVRRPEGREAVIDLLKSYESGEERMARAQHREPVDLEFLWRAVGLDREAELAATAGKVRRRGR